MIRILIEEEYGYRHWNWLYPGTKEELIDDWKNKKIPFLYHFHHENFSGNLIEVMSETGWKKFQNEWRRVLSIKCHIHEWEDSWIEIDGERYVYFDSVVSKDEVDYLFNSLKN